MAIKSEIVHLSNHLGVRILSTQCKKMFIYNNNQLPVLVLSKNTRFVIKSNTNSNRAVSPPASGKPYSGGLDIGSNGCLPVPYVYGAALSTFNVLWIVLSYFLVIVK